MVTEQPIIDDHDTALSADELAALRENLHEQRLFRQEQLRQLEQAREFPASGTGRTDAPCDRRSGPRAEVRGKLAASARMVLADIEAALARMDQGGYGFCQLCQEPIGRARLTVVPQGRYCSRCQQVREAGR
ncbi:TraR/DksA family transcriptional regulator [Streptomyces sp. NPDC060205]|uniref:TraR/DksA family transcriptional regulator n=1 Tax=Streptomyces sp. NPDC060205 TaxID=3347072 RepID=UPI003654AA93